MRGRRLTVFQSQFEAVERAIPRDRMGRGKTGVSVISFKPY